MQRPKKHLHPRPQGRSKLHVPQQKALFKRLQNKNECKVISVIHIFNSTDIQHPVHQQ